MTMAMMEMESTGTETVKTETRRVYPEYLHKYAMEYTQLGAEDLCREWSRLEGVSRETVMAKAVLLSEMIARDCDVSGIRSRYPEQYNLLLRIANGQIVPRLVELFAYKPDVLTKMGSLPIHKQAEIAESEKIEVAVRGASGEFELRKVSLSEIKKPLADQVFSSYGERTFEQQIAYIENKTVKPKQVKRSHVKLDHRAGVLKVTAPSVFTIQELEVILADLKRGR